MITLLHIENVAVIENAEISFEAGFNVLTGETGAGKSIIIDSINTLLGQRASREIIRTGAKSAFVSALFQNCAEDIDKKIEALGYPSLENGELNISREIFEDGRNVCRINTRPANLQTLRELGTALINIHGQHDSQALLDPASHLGFLDLYAANGAAYSDYYGHYTQMQEIKKRINELTLDETQKARDMDIYARQLSEIDAADLSQSEEETLISRRQVVQNITKIQNAVEDAYTALSGGEDGGGAAAMLLTAQKSLAEVENVDFKLLETARRLEELVLSANDCAHDLRSLMSGYDVTPGELEEIELRLNLIYALKKRYGSSVEDVLKYRAEIAAKLEAIELSDEELEKQNKNYLETRQKASAAAKELSSRRYEAKLKLEKSILAELSYLNMEKARFEVEIERITADGKIKLTPNGIDNVQFLIAANPGEALKPLSKTASGGELSRIMLALKNVLASCDAVPTLIFDEIDSGISGATADKVGRKLKSLKSNFQVLCVTHLAQIAARADNHLLIEKSDDGLRTSTTVRKLTGEPQKRELARIISGNITEMSLKTAEEMLINGEKND